MRVGRSLEWDILWPLELLVSPPPPQTSNIAESLMGLQLLFAQVPLLKAAIRVVQLLIEEVEMEDPANKPLLIRQAFLKLVFPIVCQNVDTPKLRGEMSQ